jgi:hypothetical protein
VAFVYEHEFALTEEDWFAVSWQPNHPKARIDEVRSRCERRMDGSIERYVGILTIRDSGHSYRGEHRQVVVVRQRGKMVELPDWAGDFVGSFTSNRDEDRWLVYAAREAPRPVDAPRERPAADSEAAPPARAPREQPAAPTPLRAPPAVEADWLPAS